MKKIRLITLIAMVCVISRTLAEPVYSLKANGKSVLQVTPIAFCPFCGETVETCRKK